MVSTQLRELENRPCMTWIGPVLTEALGADSPIVQSVQAGKIPAVHVIADQLLAGQGQKHLDHKILTIAAVYLVLGDLLLKTDPETSDREELTIACGELGRLGAWLVKSQPQTTQGIRALTSLTTDILKAREIDSESALAQGPAEKLLAIAATALSKKSRLEALSAADQSSKEKRRGNSR